MLKGFSKKITTGLLIGALAMGGYGVAYATSDNAAATTGDEPTFTAGEFKGKHPGGGGMGMQLDTLVADGVLDQATADAISVYQDQKADERRAQMEALKDLTKEEKQAYFESNKGQEPGDHFADMVDAGIITQEQADSIKEAMPQRGPDGEGEGSHPGRGGGMRMGMGMDFSALVTDGVLDQATADAISAYQEQKADECRVEMEALKDLTEEERQALFESNKGQEPGDPFADMVDAGIITQEQADSIKEAMPTPPEMPEMK